MRLLLRYATLRKLYSDAYRIYSMQIADEVLQASSSEQLQLSVPLLEGIIIQEKLGPVWFQQYKQLATRLTTTNK